MKRSEAGALLLGAALGVAVTVAVVVWAAAFATSDLSNSASNLLAILSGPSLIAALALAGWRRWHGRCAAPRCVRLGEHPVKGTTRKLCPHHHTPAGHRLAVELHRVEGRLGWGEAVDDRPPSPL